MNPGECEPQDTFYGGNVPDLGTDGQYRSVLAIEGEDKPIRLMSIYFTPATQAGGVPGAAATTDLVARITWGVGAARAVAEVDVQQGVRVVLTSRFLWIDIRTETVTAPAGPVLSVGAFVGFGAPALPNAAHRTLRIAAIASGATSAALVVPSFATRATVYREPSNLACTLFFLDRAGTVVGRVSAALGAELADVVLPHDCTQVAVRNDSGTTAMTLVRIVFELEL